MHTHPILILLLHPQVDRTSIRLFKNCPCVVGVIFRAGVLSSSAILAKNLLEKTNKRGPGQCSL